MSYLQTNPIDFDRDSLHKIVDYHVKEAGWNANWRNELTLEIPKPTDDVPIYKAGVPVGLAKYFHINVINNRRDKLATNCSAYLEKVIGPGKVDLDLKTIEFKWAGTMWPSVGIAPRTKRAFDAVFIPHNQPLQANFSVHTDTDHYIPRLPAQGGKFELHYLVTAWNFRSVRANCILNLRPTVAKTTLSLK